MKRIAKSACARIGGFASARQSHFGRDEIGCLAYLNWQHDGCPPGRDADYWLEAELQMQATWRLLITAEVGADAAKALEKDCLRKLAVAFTHEQSGHPDQSRRTRRSSRAPVR